MIRRSLSSSIKDTKSNFPAFLVKKIPNKQNYLSHTLPFLSSPALIAATDPKVTRFLSAGNSTGSTVVVSSWNRVILWDCMSLIHVVYLQCLSTVVWKLVVTIQLFDNVLLLWDLIASTVNSTSLTFHHHHHHHQQQQQLSSSVTQGWRATWCLILQTDVCISLLECTAGGRVRVTSRVIQWTSLRHFRWWRHSRLRHRCAAAARWHAPRTSGRRRRMRRTFTVHAFPCHLRAQICFVDEVRYGWRKVFVLQ